MAALRRSFLLAKDARLKIAVLDDYQGAFRSLPSFSKLQNHEVSIFTDTEKDPVRLVGRLPGCRCCRAHAAALAVPAPSDRTASEPEVHQPDRAERVSHRFIGV